jgi:cell division septum initiation protein DivIVA
MPYYASDMSSGGHSDDLAAKAADAVRGIVAEAEDRAAEIVRDADAKAAGIREQAEAEAKRIRERAEADARGQIEAAKRALDELGGKLEQRAEPPGSPETPVSPPANGDDAAERLVAMKLAVEGRDRAAIEAELSERFGASDRSALLDDVLSRAAR